MVSFSLFMALKRLLHIICAWIKINKCLVAKNLATD